ncbi:hypothetical protein [Candidatus Albibeggiatoa sp. nov. BB20]|uniref:hypothetical protein n=1 Tax=Candidatus Albibeggiatoa sp. nov. BB20 TaxID=3162723 RepID=UPI0033653DB2
MTEPMTVQRTPEKDAKTCVFMLVTILIPAIFTLSSIDIARKTIDLDKFSNPSPYSYTWSLSLFIIPMLVIGWWFLTHPSYHSQRKAFWITIFTLVPLGFLLDFLFGSLFFIFPNEGATLGIKVPVVPFDGSTVPIEEFAFYIFGVAFTLLFYLWGDEFWFGAYRVPDYKAETSNLKVSNVIKFHPRSLIIGIALIIAGIVYKKFFSGSPEGFSGYFTFLVIIAIMPSVVLFRTALPFINWRAFSQTLFIMLLISIIWEASLAVPYGWWDYNHEQMLGIFIFGWTNLPVEAALLWIAVSYTTVIVYEVFKIIVALDKPFFDALFRDSQQ